MTNDKQVSRSLHGFVCVEIKIIKTKAQKSKIKQDPIYILLK